MKARDADVPLLNRGQSIRSFHQKICFKNTQMKKKSLIVPIQSFALLSHGNVAVG